MSNRINSGITFVLWSVMGSYIFPQSPRIIPFALFGIALILWEIAERISKSKEAAK
jgi:hypothetical protein